MFACFCFFIPGRIFGNDLWILYLRNAVSVQDNSECFVADSLRLCREKSSCVESILPALTEEGERKSVREKGQVRRKPVSQMKALQRCPGFASDAGSSRMWLASALDSRKVKMVL